MIPLLTVDIVISAVYVYYRLFHIYQIRISFLQIFSHSQSIFIRGIMSKPVFFRERNCRFKGDSGGHGVICFDFNTVFFRHQCCRIEISLGNISLKLFCNNGLFLCIGSIIIYFKSIGIHMEPFSRFQQKVFHSFKICFILQRIPIDRQCG